jgi:hypothetical protein
VDFTFYLTHLVARNNKLGYVSARLEHKPMLFSSDILLIREVSTVKKRGLLKFYVNIRCKESRYSVLGIMTCFELDGFGLSRAVCKKFIFSSSHLSRPYLGFTQPPVRWAPDLYTGNKVAGTWQ